MVHILGYPSLKCSLIYSLTTWQSAGTTRLCASSGVKDYCHPKSPCFRSSNSPSHVARQPTERIRTWPSFRRAAQGTWTGSRRPKPKGRGHKAGFACLGRLIQLPPTCKHIGGAIKRITGKTCNFHTISFSGQTTLVRSTGQQPSGSQVHTRRKDTCILHQEDNTRRCFVRRRRVSTRHPSCYIYSHTKGDPPCF